MAFTVKTSTASFTRPADTTSYTSGDLVANSTTAASVIPMQFSVAASGGGGIIIRRARLLKSSATTSAATFRLHLYGTDPSASSGIANGDNAAWSTGASGYIGSIDLDVSGSNGRMFTNGTHVIGLPSVGTEIDEKISSGIVVFGLLEARGSYAPASAETFAVTLEAIQN